MTTVVFDLDGTLADTSGDLIAAANRCFQALGHGALLDPVADALTAFHGGRAMLRLGFSRLGGVDEAAVDREYPLLLAHYARDIDVRTRLYPGAAAALDRLAGQGRRLAVCTNKPEALAETLLARLGVRDRFGAMIGADTLPVRKPDPEPLAEAVRRAGGNPRDAVLIGDTETDVRTARAAGVPVVLVAFGPEGPGIARLEPDAMLPHFDALDDVLNALMRGPLRHG